MSSMTLPNYGLPEPQELVGAVRQQAQANHDALTALYQQAGAPVVATLHNNDTALSVIGKTLRTAVNRTIGTQTRRLNGLPVEGPVTGYGATQTVDPVSASFTMSPAESTAPAGNVNTLPGTVLWYVYQMPGGGCATIETADPAGAPGPIIGGGFTSYGDAIAFISYRCNPSAGPAPTPTPSSGPVMPGPTMPSSPAPAPAPAPVVGGLTPLQCPAGQYVAPWGTAGYVVTPDGRVGYWPGGGQQQCICYGPVPVANDASLWAQAHPNCGAGTTPPPGPIPTLPPTSPGVWIVACSPDGAAVAMLAADYDNQHLNWPVLQYGLPSQAAAQGWIAANPSACGTAPAPIPTLPPPTPPPPPPPAPHDYLLCWNATPPCAGYTDLSVVTPITGAADPLARYAALKESLVEIGKGLIGCVPFQLSADRVVAILLAVGGGASITDTAAADSIAAQLASIDWSTPGPQDNIIASLSSFFGGAQETLLPLIACRVYLQATDAMVMGVSAGMERDGGRKEQIGIGGENGIPGVARHRDEGCAIAFDYHADIHTMLIFGIDVIERLIAAEAPAELPGPGDVIEAYLHDTLPEAQAQYLLRLNGCDPDLWLPIIGARREQLTAQEYIQWARRHGMPADTQAALIRRLGFLNPDEARARVELYDELPTVADFLHFITRNVYDTEYVQRYDLDEGFEDRMWANYGSTLEAIGLSKRWALEHYRAHWITAAPGQLAEMTYRLRPDKPGVQNPFTPDDYERLLAEQDVAPFIRKRFRETLYHVPALSYIREMYRNYTVGDDELRSIHLDLGFSPADADRFVAVDRLARSRMRASEAHGWTPAALAKGFVSGRLTALDVTGRMASMGYTAEEADQLMARAQADLDYSTFMRARSRTVFAALSQVKQALTVGVIDQAAAAQQLQGMGWSANFAQSWVQITGIQGRVSVVKQGVSTIRGAYYRGEVNQQQAAQLLQQLGIVPAAVDQYVTLWGVRLGRKRRQLSKAEIIKELCEGAISTGDAVARLANLGYESPDIELYIADAGRCIASRRSKAQAAAARQAASESKTLLKLQQEAARQAKQLLREAEKAEPVSKLQKWAKLGIIQPAYFARRMRRYGYSDQEITDYWQEAASAKGSNADPAAIGPELQGAGNREPGSFAGSAAP